MKQLEKISNRLVLVLIVIAGISLFESCEKYSFKVETLAPGDSIYFQKDIQPIFTATCINCHKGSRNPDLRTGNSYTSLTDGDYITPPDSTCSFYSTINSGHPTSLSLVNRQKILLWVKQGAKNN
jgi:hypothetical protein